MSDEVKEPFDTPPKPRDFTGGFHYTEEDLLEKKNEIRDQIQYLLNLERKIDESLAGGAEVMSEQEVREYLKLDSIDPRMSIPKDIPKIRMGVGYVYYRRDIKKFLDSRRRGGK